MVSIESIKKIYSRKPEGGVNQLVYPQDREGVFGTSLIEISEVHTNSPLPIFSFTTTVLASQSR